MVAALVASFISFFALLNPQASANDSAPNGDLNQLLQFLQKAPGTQGADVPKIHMGVSCLTGKPVQMTNSSAGEFVPDPNPCDAKALFARYVPVLGMASEIEKMEGISPEQKKKLFEQKFNESFAKENGFNAAVLAALPHFIKEQEQHQIDDALRDRVFTKLKNYAPWANYFERIEKGDQAGLCFLAADRGREEKDPQLKEALQTTAKNLRDLVQARSPNGVPPIIGIAFGSGDLGGYGIARGIPAEYQRTIIDGMDETFAWYNETKAPGFANNDRYGGRFITDWSDEASKTNGGRAEINYQAMLTPEEYAWFQNKFPAFHQAQKEKFTKVQRDVITARVDATTNYNHAYGQVVGEVWKTLAIGIALKPLQIAIEAGLAANSARGTAAGVGAVEAVNAYKVASSAKNLFKLKNQSAMEFLARGAFRSVQVGIGAAAFNATTHLINDHFGSDGKLCNLVKSVEKNGTPFKAAATGAALGGMFYGFGGPFAHKGVQVLMGSIRTAMVTGAVVVSGKDAIDHAGNALDHIDRGDFSNATGDFLHLANLAGLGTFVKNRLASGQIQPKPAAKQVPLPIEREIDSSTTASALSQVSRAMNKPQTSSSASNRASRKPKAESENKTSPFKLSREEQAARARASLLQRNGISPDEATPPRTDTPAPYGVVKEKSAVKIRNSDQSAQSLPFSDAQGKKFKANRRWQQDLDRALRNTDRNQTYSIRDGGAQGEKIKKVVLAEADLRYILVRHHPKYWNGQSEGSQTFFSRNMEISQLRGLIGRALIAPAKKGRQMREYRYYTENGTHYELVTYNGHIIHFSPIEEIFR